MVGVVALVDGRVVAGELRLGEPLELQADLIRGRAGLLGGRLGSGLSRRLGSRLGGRLGGGFGVVGAAGCDEQ